MADEEEKLELTNPREGCGMHDFVPGVVMVLALSIIVAMTVWWMT